MIKAERADDKLSDRKKASVWGLVNKCFPNDYPSLACDSFVLVSGQDSRVLSFVMGQTRVDSYSKERANDVLDFASQYQEIIRRDVTVKTYF